MIAPTGKVRGLLQGYGVRCPVFVVPTGIDLRRFQQEGDPMRRAVLRASLGIPAENTVLVCVGRLAEEKNIPELLGFFMGNNTPKRREYIMTNLEVPKYE